MEAVDDYAEFLYENLHRRDCDFIQDCIEYSETESDVVGIMDAYERGLRIYTTVYGKRNKNKYQRFVRICNTVLTELVSGHPTLSNINKYLDFCETYQPESTDIARLLELISGEVDPWWRGISFCFSNNQTDQGYLLLKRVWEKFTNDRIKVEIFKVELTIAASARTPSLMKKASASYSNLVEYIGFSTKVYKDLLVHLGKIDYPVSDLVCKILWDIEQKHPKTPLGKFAGICVKVESVILQTQDQILEGKEAYDVSKEFAAFLTENADPSMFELYFYFLDRIRSIPMLIVPWFDFLKDESAVKTTRNWWTGLLTMKRPVPIEVLRNAVANANTLAEKKKVVPLAKKVLYEAIFTNCSDTVIKDLFDLIVGAPHPKEDHELWLFRFHCWKMVHDYAKDGTKLKEAVQRVVGSQEGPFLLFFIYREKGIDAARSHFKSVEKPRVLVEIMLEIEEAQPEVNMQVTRPFYLDLAFRLTETPFEEETRDCSEILIKWADAEAEHGSASYVQRFAEEVLYGDSLNNFQEKWSHTRLHILNNAMK